MKLTVNSIMYFLVFVGQNQIFLSRKQNVLNYKISTYIDLKFLECGTSQSPPVVCQIVKKNKVPVQVLWYFQASLPEADRHDTSSIYRKLTLAELQQEVPQIDWLQYLKSFMDTDINQDELVVAYAMPYFIQMGKIIADTDRRFLSTNSN